MAFPMLGLALLAGVGVDRWFSQQRRLRELVWILPVLVGAVALIEVFFAVHQQFLMAKGIAGYVRNQVAIADLFAVLGLLCLAAQCFVMKPRVLATLFTVVLAADLAVAARSLHDTSPRRRLFFDTKLTRFLEEGAVPPRVNATSAGIPTGLLQAYGIEQQWGYDGILPERMYTFFGKLGGDLWSAMEPVCATDYYLSAPECTATFPKDDPARFVRIDTLDGVAVFGNTQAFPRAFLVGELAVVQDIEAMFARMREPEFDPKRVVLTEAPPPVVPSESIAVEVGTAAVRERTATRVVVDVDSAEDAVLVLADAYYPGWQVRIDGVRGQIFPAYYAFRGVTVPAGRYTVEFLYRPPSFTYPLLVSTITLLLGVAASARILLRRDRGRAG
jgi:hypothetical protein